MLRLLLVPLLLTACGDEAPTGPPAAVPEPDPLAGRSFEMHKTLRSGALNAVVWTFEGGRYRIEATIDGAVYRRISGVYEVYRDLTTDPPGWGVRGTRIWSEDIDLDTGEVLYDSFPVVWDVPLTVGQSAIRLGANVMAEVE